MFVTMHQVAIIKYFGEFEQYLRYLVCLELLDGFTWETRPKSMDCK